MSTVSALASMDRARVYRALACLFRTPEPDALRTLHGDLLPELCRALSRLGAQRELENAARELEARLERTAPEGLERSYHDTFEASGGLRCPPNEAPYLVDTPQHALRRTYELADVAGFYRAFGVEVLPGTESPDHISAELEFMHLLAVKEAVALQAGEVEEHAKVCRDAARAFLRDHLVRWVPHFAERLEQAAAETAYGPAARLLSGFVALDAISLGAE